MILEIIFISVIGTLLHFTYDWSNHNKVVGIFSAVNESTWEHIKMGLSATFLCSIADFFFFNSNPNYFFAKFICYLLVIMIMPIIFYVYTYFTKKSILIIDILSFYITIIISNFAFYKLLNIKGLPFIYNYIGYVGQLVIFGFYMILTLMPLKNFLFKDPITQEYGIKAHK